MNIDFLKLIEAGIISQLFREGYLSEMEYNIAQQILQSSEG